MAIDGVAGTRVDGAEERPQELSEEAVARFFNQVMTIYIVPEIEARQARGEAPKPFPLLFAQVVFKVDMPPVVRLNSEVHGSVMVSPADPARVWNAGEDVMLEDIGGICDFALPDEDANAAHITLLAHASGYSLTFDATYNRARIAEHLRAAEEFMVSADQALTDERLTPFVENAFHAAEHLAKAELLPLPDERFLRAKTHRTVASRLHWWSNLGNIDPDAAKLLSQLDDLRQRETYLADGRRLGRESAKEIYERLMRMRDSVVKNAPQKGPSPQGRRSRTMLAARNLEAGQLVRLSDNRMP